METGVIGDASICRLEICTALSDKPLKQRLEKIYLSKSGKSNQEVLMNRFGEDFIS